MRSFRAADIFTIPNAISAVGLGLVLHGSRRADTGGGIAETVAGRLLDLLDGKVARLLDQSSEFGAGIDAAFDKAGVLAIGVNEWRGHLAPRPALLVIAAQNAVNLAATAAATRWAGDTELAPVKDGKSAMAYQNGALGAYAVATLLRKHGHDRAATLFRLVGHADTLVGTGYFGLRASRQYVGRLIDIVRSDQPPTVRRPPSA